MNSPTVTIFAPRAISLSPLNSSNPIPPLPGLPFAYYPGGGEELLGRSRGSSFLWEYGYEYVKVTNPVLACVYCSFNGSQRHLRGCDPLTLLRLDHVIPWRRAEKARIPAEWFNDFSSHVLACKTCNSLCNRYNPLILPMRPWTLNAFFRLRDRIFLERRKLILERLAQDHQQCDSIRAFVVAKHG